MVNERTILDLKYGHPGPAAFDLESNAWSFARNFEDNHDTELVQLGDFECLLKGTPSPALDDTEQDEATSQRDDYRHVLERTLIPNLIEDFPELQPAKFLLSSLHRRSEAVTAAVAKYDPAQGSLFEYGSISMRRTGGVRRRIRLLALPGGSCGEHLRLVRVWPHNYGWGDEKDYLKTFAPVDEVGWWIGKGAPILQVCWPEALKGKSVSSFLAIRLPGATIIFEPSYERQLVPPSGVSLGCAHPPSRICVKPLLEISPAASNTGLHADVTFNPWHHDQFAVVDNCGRWSVFTIAPPYNDGDSGTVSNTKILLPRTAKLIKSGTVVGAKSGNADSMNPEVDCKQDGWARILWAGDQDTLVICTRRHIAVVSLESQAFSPIIFPSNLGRQRGCHLDCVRCPSRPHWLFLLTTEQIFWIHIFKSDEQDGETDQLNLTKARVILAARHFRNPLDITLRLKLVDDNENMLALISSRMNQAVSCFRFAVKDPCGTFPAWASDPTQISLPAKNQSISSVLDISMRRIDSIAVDSVTPSMVNRYYSLQLLSKNFDLHHAFLYSKPEASELSRTWPPTLRERPPKRIDPKNNHFIVRDELFQTPPRLTTPLAERIVERRRRYKATYNRNEVDDPIERSKRGPTLELAITFTDIAHTLPTKDAPSFLQDVDDIARFLKNIVLDGSKDLGRPAMTLLEHVQSIPTVSDITTTGPVFESLFETTSLSGSGAPGLAVERFQLPKWMTGLSPLSQDLTFMHVYNYLIDHNIKPIGPKLSTKTRVAKERGLRSAATQFLLASASIVHTDTNQEYQDTLDDIGRAASIDNALFERIAEDGKPMDLDLEMEDSKSVVPSLEIWKAESRAAGDKFSLPWHPSPFRNEQSSAIAAAIKNMPSSSENMLPSPLPTRSPSVSSISHESFGKSHHRTAMRMLRVRMGRYCEIRNPPRGKDLKPAVLLKHWDDPFEDPDLYHFQTAHAAIDQALEESQMTTQQREKKYQKIAKLEKKKRREEEKWMKMQAEMSSQTTIMVSSPPRSLSHAEDQRYRIRSGSQRDWERPTILKTRLDAGKRPEPRDALVLDSDEDIDVENGHMLSQRRRPNTQERLNDAFVGESQVEIADFEDRDTKMIGSSGFPYLGQRQIQESAQRLFSSQAPGLSGSSQFTGIPSSQVTTFGPGSHYTGGQDSRPRKKIKKKRVEGF